MSITRGLAKLLLFAAIVIAGIVFISEGFMARVDLGVARVEDYARGVLQKKEPAITGDFSSQTQETKTEISNLYQNISGIAWNNFKSWISEKISGVWQYFTK